MIEKLTRQVVAMASVTICCAGLMTSCSGNKSAEPKPPKLTILSDRQCVPPPYTSPRQLNAGKEAPNVAAPAEIAQDTFLPAGTDDNAFKTAEPTLDAPVFAPAGGVGSTETATAAKAAPRTYKVTRGDNLSIIAYMYRITWQELASENNLTAKSVLQVGQVLRLPAGASEKPRTRPVIKSKKKTTAAKPVVKKSTAATAKAAASGDIHVVKSGENLWTIARAYKVKEADIKALNPQIKDFSKLKIGDKLRIRGTAKAEAAPIIVEPKAIPGQVIEDAPVAPAADETITVPAATEEIPVAPAETAPVLDAVTPEAPEPAAEAAPAALLPESPAATNTVEPTVAP